MPDFHIREILPDGRWPYRLLHELEVAVSVELMGEDQTRSLEQLGTHLTDERNALKGLLVAVPGPAPADVPLGRFGLPVAADDEPELLGAAEFALPLLDNTHLLDDLYIQVVAGSRRRGIGSALWREVRRIAAEQGRDTILGWSEHPVVGEQPAQRLRPSAGDGYLPVDRATRFAQSLGVGLAQVERMSRLDLPVPPRRLADLRSQAEAHALPTYRIVSWAGPVPEEHLDAVAQLNVALSTDAPMADVDWQPEVWDAARVRHADDREHLTGRGIRSLALVAGTGEAAGITHIHCEYAHPERPEQWNTTVAAAHRGHRLGLLLKVANLQLLAAEVPQAKYINTWNAGENSYMLAINTALGFRLHAVTGAWQLRL